MKLFEMLLRTLNDETLLCVASDITGPNQMIKTMYVKQWKTKSIPQINKVNTIFLVQA